MLTTLVAVLATMLVAEPATPAPVAPPTSPATPGAPSVNGTVGAGGGGTVWARNGDGLVVEVPSGWVLDNRALRQQGIDMLFYPAGAKFQGGGPDDPVFAYVMPTIRGNASVTVEGLVEIRSRQITDFDHGSSVVREAPPPGSAAERKGSNDNVAFVRYSIPKMPRFERVAYLDDGRTIFAVILSAVSEGQLEKSAAFVDQVVGDARRLVAANKTASRTPLPPGDSDALAIGEVLDAAAAVERGANSCAKGSPAVVRKLGSQQVEEVVNRGKDRSGREYLLTPIDAIFQFTKGIEGVPGPSGAAAKTAEVLVELYIYASPERARENVTYMRKKPRWIERGHAEVFRSVNRYAFKVTTAAEDEVVIGMTRCVEDALVAFVQKAGSVSR